MALKALLFDLDNTLFDFMRYKTECCKAALKAMKKAGLKINEKKGMKILFDVYKEHGIEYEQIFQKFLEKVGKNQKVDYDILAKGILAYRKRRQELLKPYPGVEKTLKMLKKKHKLAVITDAPRVNAWLRLTSMKLDRYFDAVVTAADVRKKKTFEAPFKAALKKLKVKPEEAIMVGDRPERDIIPAKKLGMKTVFARYGNPKVKRSGADWEIGSIVELIKVVGGIK